VVRSSILLILKPFSSEAFRMIIVNFFTTLRTYLKSRQSRIYAEDISMFELLQRCETDTGKALVSKLINEDGSLIPGVMILINGQNILHLQGIRTIVRNGADVAIFPPKTKE